MALVVAFVISGINIPKSMCDATEACYSVLAAIFHEKEGGAKVLGGELLPYSSTNFAHYHIL